MHRDPAIVRRFDAPEALDIRFYEILARSAINRVPKASRLPFRSTIHPYRGSTHACTYCASGETPILMADGRYKPVRKLRVGDEISAPSDPGSTTRPSRVEPLLEAAAAAGATGIGGIALHLRGEVKQIFFDWLRAYRPDLVERYEQLYSRGAYAPLDQRNRLAAPEHLRGRASDRDSRPASLLGGRPVDLFSKVGGSEGYQLAAVNRPVVAVAEREPPDRVLLRIKDQDLVDTVARVERELLPRLIARRHDLDDDHRRRKPDPARDRAVHATIGNAVVVLGLTEVELAHRGHETRVTTRPVEEHCELLSDVRVLARRGGHHVPNSLPDFVQAIKPRPPPPLQQLIEARGGGFEDQRAHTAESNPRAAPSTEHRLGTPATPRPSACPKRDRAGRTSVKEGAFATPRDDRLPGRPPSRMGDAMSTDPQVSSQGLEAGAELAHG